MMRRLLALAVVMLAVPAFAADSNPLEDLRKNVREALRNAATDDAPLPLRHLEQAAEDVDALTARVERHVDASVQFLRDIRPCDDAAATTAPPPEMPGPIDELQKAPEEVDRAFADLDAARADVERLVKPQSPESFAAAVRRALENADDMLTRRRDASIAARWLRRFAEERRSAETHQSLCRLLESVAPLPEPFTLADIRRDPLLPVRRAGEAAHAQLMHRANALQRGEWSLGLGVEWTPPQKDANGHDDVRAGQPIAMLAFRPLPEDLPIFRDASIRPWVQVGTGLQFDQPSFYVGGAFDLGPYALVGVGWTAQQVTTTDGEEFDGSVYVSMTLRLERMRRWMRSE